MACDNYFEWVVIPPYNRLYNVWQTYWRRLLRPEPRFGKEGDYVLYAVVSDWAPSAAINISRAGKKKETRKLLTIITNFGKGSLGKKMGYYFQKYHDFTKRL